MTPLRDMRRETALFRPERLDGVLAVERDRFDERGQDESFPLVRPERKR